MEKRYWELREEYENAFNKYVVNPCESNLLAYKEALSTYQDFCMDVLESLIGEHSDVLSRLKD